MSHTCVEATAKQSCARCAREFKPKELILTGAEGPVCIGACWRTPIDFKANPLTTTSQMTYDQKNDTCRAKKPPASVEDKKGPFPIKRVAEIEPVLPSDELKKGIEEFAVKLSKEKK